MYSEPEYGNITTFACKIFLDTSWAMYIQALLLTDTFFKNSVFKSMLGVMSVMLATLTVTYRLGWMCSNLGRVAHIKFPRKGQIENNKGKKMVGMVKLIGHMGIMLVVACLLF